MEACASQVWEDAKQAMKYSQGAANRHHKSFTAHVAMRVGYYIPPYKVIQGVAGRVEPSQTFEVIVSA